MENRLTELEIKLAFQDDLLDALNDTVARQQQQIDTLQAQLRELYDMVRGLESGAGRRPPAEEIPPHY
ncbi:SlyX family protein [Chitiniphilus eburneus]|uniref:Protein SlyX homolog n=1 Tax=Chitiniphilus eburneus TaxID=2571148 RepID=A0A4U0Q9H8_9NEIS|nr:SlyX family protein [Chitiniphilus eburneus]TJZ77600.1 SlyX family protein [Chitiniphilus eburneus]